MPTSRVPKPTAVVGSCLPPAPVVTRVRDLHHDLRMRSIKALFPECMRAVTAPLTRRALNDIAAPLNGMRGAYNACDLPFALDFKLLLERCRPMGGPAPAIAPRSRIELWVCACFSTLPLGSTKWRRRAMVGGCAKETTINAFPQQVSATTCPNGGEDEWQMTSRCTDSTNELSGTIAMQPITNGHIRCSSSP